MADFDTDLLDFLSELSRPDPLGEAPEPSAWPPDLESLPDLSTGTHVASQSVVQSRSREARQKEKSRCASAKLLVSSLTTLAERCAQGDLQAAQGQAEGAAQAGRG